MNLWVIAWRNLLRNRRRSLTTIFAIVVGASSVLIFGGYSRSIVLSIQTEYVDKVGHLQIQHVGYFNYGAGNPEVYGISNYQQIIEEIRRDPKLAPLVAVVTPMLQFGGIASNAQAGTSRMVQGVGLMADDSAKMRQWNDYDIPYPPETAKKYLASLAGTSEDSAIVGNGLARMLQLCRLLQSSDCAQQKSADIFHRTVANKLPDDVAFLVENQSQGTPGDKDDALDILAASASGAPNVVRVNVVRAQDQGVKELDDVAIQMHLMQAQKLVYGRGSPEVTSVVLQLKHTAQMQEAREELLKIIERKFNNSAIEVLDFAKLNPLYEQAINMFRSIFGFIFVLISVVVLFTVSNTMSMSIVERTVEIGTLRAMGLRRGGIQRMFICEAALLGVLGAVIGVVASLLIASLINHAGITWTPPGRAEPVQLNVWVWGSPTLIAGSISVLIVAVILSAWVPASRAAKMEIVAALRHV